MLARIAADVGSRIAQTAKQGKMACRDVLLQIKAAAKDEDIPQQVFWSLIVLGLALGSWSLGRLSVSPGQSLVGASSVEIRDVFKDAQDRFACRPQEAQDREEGTEASPRPEGSVVASKNGSKYHLPRCPGARSIKDENKIWFESESSAQAAGYTRAGNCK